MQLLPYLQSQITTSTTRVDAVCNVYKESSLKYQTRCKRGQGQRTRVAPTVPLPQGAQWQKFLQDSSNKEDFSHFISLQLHNCVKELNPDFNLSTTRGEGVLSSKPIDLDLLSPCLQEEADTRMMLHLHHAAQHGHTKAYLRNVDSYVVEWPTAFSSWAYHSFGSGLQTHSSSFSCADPWGSMYKNPTTLSCHDRL